MADSRLPAQGPPLEPPRWARAADLLSLLLLLAAGLVAMSGGFRSHIGRWHFIVTSPYRILLWAAVVSVVRHVLAPQPPVYRRLPGQIARWARSTPFRTALLVLVGTRPAILLAGYLAVFLFGYGPGSAPIRSSEDELLNLPVRWDTGWYLQIAADGYSYKPNFGTRRQQNIVFFPAFPLLTRVGAWLLGNTKASYVGAGVFVSLAAFLVGLVYIFKLAREQLELGEEESATALWLLAAYPFALFFGAAYTESLFLAAAAGAFWHLSRHEHRSAIAWGIVTGLTRPNGFLLSIPLALVAVSPWLPAAMVRGGRPRGAAGAPNRATLGPALLVASAPTLGMVAYSIFIWSLTGRPFAWAEGHEAWGRHYEGFATLIVDRYNFISQSGFLTYVSDLPVDLLNGLGVLFVLVASWPVARRFGLEYAVFIWINILPPLAAGGLMSAGRFSSVLFPAFIWMAAAVPPRQRPCWAVSFAAIQALNATLFYTWRPLF
jgi:hypothetical protein